jgi:hypothetical protein
VLERPCRVIGDIGGDTEFAAGAQNAPYLGNRMLLNEPSFPVAALGPWIRLNEIDPRQRFLCDAGQQFPGVSGMKPDICDVLCSYGRECLGHAVDERLNSYEPGFRICFCFGNEMFAAAEPDFEANLANRLRIQGTKIPGKRSEVQTQLRQDGSKQELLSGL